MVNIQLYTKVHITWSVASIKKIHRTNLSMTDDNAQLPFIFANIANIVHFTLFTICYYLNDFIKKRIGIKLGKCFGLF